jgi:hypothetical protein
LIAATTVTVVVVGKVIADKGRRIKAKVHKEYWLGVIPWF